MWTENDLEKNTRGGVFVIVVFLNSASNEKMLTK